jgi:[acyl-carrier-protein] S-malonyltransferase
LREALDAIRWRPPAFPVVTNLAAQPYADVGEIPDVLERQLRSPVLWSRCVQALGSLGCDVFVEVGPKRALTGMMRELAPDATAIAVSSPEAVERLE